MGLRVGRGGDGEIEDGIITYSPIPRGRVLACTLDAEQDRDQRARAKGRERACILGILQRSAENIAGQLGRYFRITGEDSVDIRPATSDYIQTDQ